MNKEFERSNAYLNDFYSKEWEYGHFIDHDDLFKLLTGQQFSTMVRESINLTDQVTPEVDSASLEGVLTTEYGFAGFQKSYSPDRNVYLTPLFAGGQGRIRFTKDALDYIADLLQPPFTQVLDYHTHPSVYFRFGSCESFIKFDPKRVYDNSKFLAAAQRNPLRAYREAGLNVAR